MSNNYSLNEVSHRFKISMHALRNRIRTYRHDGHNNELKKPHTWRRYSLVLKLSAINDYLSGYYSLVECCNKYNISNDSVLSSWVHQYTNGKILKKSHRGSTRMQAKRRKTTFEERLEIVQFVIKHDKDYLAAVKKYLVSYAQIYNWVRKYKQEGPNGSIDYRSKQRPNEKWVTDVTYLTCGSNQKAYLSAIKGLDDGSITSYVVSVSGMITCWF